MRNAYAFNLVPWEAALHQCAIHFPELFPWVTLCYLQWHPMGQLISASGVQQGDPLGPRHFAFVYTAPFSRYPQTPMQGIAAELLVSG